MGSCTGQSLREIAEQVNNDRVVRVSNAVLARCLSAAKQGEFFVEFVVANHCPTHLVPRIMNTVRQHLVTASVDLMNPEDQRCLIISWAEDAVPNLDQRSVAEDDMPSLIPLSASHIYNDIGQMNDYIRDIDYRNINRF